MFYLEYDKKVVTTDENGFPFNPNDLYKASSPSKDLENKALEIKKETGEGKNLNVSNIEDY